MGLAPVGNLSGQIGEGVRLQRWCFSMNQKHPTIRTPSRRSEQAEFLNKDECAALLGVSRRTIDNLLAAGLLPHVRLSKRCIRFPRQAVLDAMAARTIGVK